MQCSICNGKQLIPFVKDGRTIPYAWVNCICKVEEPERFQEIRPDDFDFPCSSFFREYIVDQYGRPSEQRTKVSYLDYESPEPTPEPPQPWGKRQQYQIDQVRSELMNIKHTLAERTKPKQPQQHPQKSTYKGLVMNE